MKTVHVIGLSMLAGIALGGIAVQGLYAQAKAVYFVAITDEVIKEADYQTITGRPDAAVAELLKPFGGEQITRGGKIERLDGTPPTRVVINRFDSAERAQAWYNSSDQKKVNEIRMNSSKSRSFLVVGM